MIPRPIQLLGIAVAAATMLATAYLMIMTTFMVYDDEGFVLMSLRRFLGGESLYDRVFSQYGPAPYLYHWLLTFAGSLELTHMFGRLVTLIHWVVCAGGVGWIAAQLSGRYRFTVGAFAAFFAFNLLWQMIAEPSHPGSMIAAAIAVAAILAVNALRVGAFNRLAVVAGVTGAILVFTKINVGAFFVAGVGAFALTCTAWPDAGRKPAATIALVGLALLPWLLMAGNLGDPAMLGFALKASLSAALIGWILPAPDRESLVPAKTWITTAAWFLSGSAVIIGFVLLRGTSATELIAAVFLDPLRQPGNFTVAPRGSLHSSVFALISFVIVGWAGWQKRKVGEIGTKLLQTALFVRLALVVGFIWFALRWPGPWGAFTYLDYVFPLLPLWLVRGTGSEKPSTRLAWALLAFVAVTQVLHAYPVAGSQIGWGCFLSIAIMAAGLARDCHVVTQRYSPWIARGALTGALVAAAVGTAHLGRTGWDRYRDSQPLPFPGAGDIRLDDRTRIALTAMVQNAAVHSDVLFTRQGMYSFNIWSQVPTPTARNATHWFWLLDEIEQQEIIDRLDTASRSAFIVNAPLDDFLNQIGVKVAGPLQDFMESHYASAFTIRGFDFRVPADQPIAELGWAFLAQSYIGASGGENEAPWHLMLDVLIQGTPASIEVVEFDANGTAHPSDLGFINPQFAPIRSDGALMAKPRDLMNAGRLEGIFNFTAQTDRPAVGSDLRNKGVVIKDAQGAVLAEALIQ